MTLEWKEEIDSVEPGQASFTMEGGGKQSTYILTPEEPEDCLTAITDILGDTAIEAGDGTLRRSLPKSHPQYAWLYASSIQSVKGRGHQQGEAFDEENLQDADEELEVPPIADQYVLYDEYAYTVQFTPRPYAVVGDDEINIYTGHWVKFDGDAESYKYCNEWERFVDFVLMPPAADSYITAQQGQMTFRTDSGHAPGSSPYTGGPRMYLPNQILKLIWYAVPYRYFTSTNSYLNGPALGCINQNEWFGYQPGQMLYLGCNPNKFSPPVPDEIEYATVLGATTFSVDKLMNVELNFLVTTRDTQAADLPTSPPSGNENFIIGGHNLLPWFGTRRFYYAASNATVNSLPKDTPSFLSYPMERLFYDPDTVEGEE